jgi:hypothetical protein
MSKPLPKSYIAENLALAKLILSDAEKYGISQEWAKLILKRYEVRKEENES